MKPIKNNVVLVIENNVENRTLTREFLELLDYFVIEVDHKKNVVDIAFSKNPNLILIDLSFPNALDIIHDLRQKREISNIPILATSDDGNKAIDLFLNIEKFGDGFIGYFPKPTTLNSLSDQLEMLFLDKMLN